MRLDPLSVPYRAASSVSQAIFGVIALAFVVRGVLGVRFPEWLLVPAVLLGVLVALGWEVAYHRRFEYALSEDTLDIAAGVVSRRVREIPVARIQNVDVRQGIVPRLLGLAEVRFETAGGSETEASLRFVSVGTARDLQRRLESGTTPSAADEDEQALAGADAEAVASSPRELLYQIRPRELALLSVTSLDLRTLGFVAAAAAGVIPIAMGGEEVPVAMPLPERVPSVVVVLLTDAIVLPLLGAAVNAALLTSRYYEFRLWATERTLSYERGLLRRFSGTLPRSRIQLLRVRDNPLTRLLGYSALDIETAGYGPSEEDQSESAVPIAASDRVMTLARNIEPFDRASLERPPRRARRRYAVRYALAALVLVAIAFAFDRFVRPVPWYLPALLVALAPVAAHLAWRHRGYAVGEGHLFVRAGFWRRTTYVVPAHRVQTVTTTATPFQRRWDLATLRIDTASGAPAAMDLDATTAARVRDAVAERLQQNRRRRVR